MYLHTRHLFYFMVILRGTAYVNTSDVYCIYVFHICIAYVTYLIYPYTHTPIHSYNWTLFKLVTWLNDEVINYYMQMLNERDVALCAKNPARRASHCFSSFFMERLLDGDRNVYTFQNIKRWVVSLELCGFCVVWMCVIRFFLYVYVYVCIIIRWTNNFSKYIDIFEKKKLFFPINIGNTHWAMMVVYVQEKRVMYLDSMGQLGNKWVNLSCTAAVGATVVGLSICN
jgi:hypothetical protein